MQTAVLAPADATLHAQVLRTALLADDWHVLEDPTDFRLHPPPGQRGGWVRTIIYCPALKALGGSTRLWRDGHQDLPAGAVYREFYQYTRSDSVGTWLPV